MSIFLDIPGGGVAPGATTNAYDPHNAPTCSPLYYPDSGCDVQIRNAWLNSIISELACAVDSTGAQMRCNSLCNLSGALLRTGTLSGYCGQDEAAAAAQKGAALAAGDYWLNTTTGVVSYVDGDGASVAIDGLAVFVCCKTGRIYTRCGDGMVHLPGSGEIANFRLEGICATDEANAIAAGLAEGGFWIDTNADPRVVYVYDGASSTPVTPQPDFFACCNSNSLYVRCGNDYFDPANCSSQPAPSASGSIWTGLTTRASWSREDVSSLSVHPRFGPEHPKRKIIVAVMTLSRNGNAAIPPSSVTVGGTAASSMASVEYAYNVGDIGAYHTSIWLAEKPGGGDHGAVTVNVPSNARIAMRVIRADTGTSIASAVDTIDHATQPYTMTVNATGDNLIIAAGAAYIHDPSDYGNYAGRPPWAPRPMIAPCGQSQDDQTTGEAAQPLGTAIYFANGSFSADFECYAASCTDTVRATILLALPIT